MQEDMRYSWHKKLHPEDSRPWMLEKNEIVSANSNRIISLISELLAGPQPCSRLQNPRYRWSQRPLVSCVVTEKGQNKKLLLWLKAISSSSNTTGRNWKSKLPQVCCPYARDESQPMLAGRLGIESWHDFWQLQRILHEHFPGFQVRYNFDVQGESKASDVSN